MSWNGAWSNNRLFQLRTQLPAGMASTLDVLDILARELSKLVQKDDRFCGSSSATPMPSLKRPRIQDEGCEQRQGPRDGQVMPSPDQKNLHCIFTAYFPHVHPWIPMLHQARFLERWENREAGQPLLLVVYAMIAAAGRHISDFVVWDDATRD